MLSACYKRQDSYNPEASQMYLYNLSGFIKEVRRCVEISLANKYESASNSCLKFSPFTTVHGKILENLFTRPEVKL